MKLHLKIILLAVTSFFIISTMAFSTFANGETVMSKASTPPVIDGVGNDSCWADITAETISQGVDPGNVIVPGCASASFKVTYDNDYIYVYALVNDQTPSNTIGTSPWQSDSFEFFIDASKSGTFAQIRANKNGALSGSFNGA